MQMTIEVMKQALQSLLELAYCDSGEEYGHYYEIVETALRQAISQPDCRGCAQLHSDELCQLGCTNGDKFQALAPVRLYKVT
jgi:hypothetical protein